MKPRLVRLPRAAAWAVLAILLLLPAPRAGARPDPWETTLARVARAVLTIEVSATRPLDTEGATATEGTGFIVDLARGLVLTNRHMVHVGPVRARGITLDKEEVELEPIYRDPVHDFGFYRFDPSEVRFMGLAELSLQPERARVGTAIRVVGNDAGEKLSILDGTLARLDRPAPHYGTDSYNDFNTFYYQAATSTSGGSSGSPVVDVTGAVLALNAGGATSAASSFYLPVHRARRALDLLRRGEPVPRGDIQATLLYQPFEVLSRLGLAPGTEAAVRKALPRAEGMLVVDSVVPGGPCDGLVQPGDILVRVAGRLAEDFDVLEDALDARVGQQVRLALDRAGRSVEVDVRVDDLHRLTPSRFIEFSQAILQETSLQIARNRHVPARGVVLIEPGYAFRNARIGSGTLVLAVDDQPVEDLDALASLLAGLPDGRKVRVRYRGLSSFHQDKVAVLTVDRHWSPARDCRRNDASGLWDCHDLPEPPTAPALQAPGASASFEAVRDPVAARLAPSLCHIRFTIPFRTEGVEGWSYIGTGLVVDTQEGLVVTDRGTVPISLGDAELTFAGSVRVPAEVLFLHPVHNVAVLRYDPARLGSVPVVAARLAPGADLDAGDAVHQVGLTSSSRVVSQSTRITRVDLAAGASPRPPCFQEANAEVWQIAEAASSIGGVLADREARVVGLWAFQLEDSGSGHFYGLPVDSVVDVVEPFRRGQEPVLRDLGLEVDTESLAGVRDQGLPAALVTRLEQADPERRQALVVLRIHPDAPAASVLAGGDVLLALDGVPVTRPRQIESLLADAGPTVRVTRLVDGRVEDVEVEPVVLDGRGIRRAVAFAGALLHAPHRALGMMYGLPADGLYLSWYWYGGPAAQYGLHASTLVRAVNDVPVHDLDSFLAVVRTLGDRAPVRVRVCGLNGAESVHTLLTDQVYWPTSLLERGSGGWHHAPLHSEDAKGASLR
ncbi:MAG: trypsin-like peptidase domain-containing protein [Deltaproteobacteria bacterium]|nr:trypsin-like peptidase domain-containing protein [Deltaproteobacteria bacterium]